MNLEKNLIDNILECEIKLGHADIPITFYYPVTSLCELLNCDQESLVQAMERFQRDEVNRLGKVIMEELPSEKGRYGVTIPAEGLGWVHKNFTPSPFMKDFIREIQKKDNTISDLVDLFHRYSMNVLVRQVSEDEWSICFADERVDPYVYHIEKNVFGLEYHRFTREAYNELS